MSHYLNVEPSVAKVGGLQPIILLKNIPYFHSSFYAVLATIPFLAETVSVTYYARNGVTKMNFLKKTNEFRQPQVTRSLIQSLLTLK